MDIKRRHEAPKCEGRFPNLRERASLVATEWRDDSLNPEARINNSKELIDFVQRMAGPAGINTEYTPQDVIALLSQYDQVKPHDPYFNNKEDKLRGDPLAGNDHNVYPAMVPFVLEAMRESLLDRKKSAELFISTIKAGEYDDQLAEDVLRITGKVFEFANDAEREEAIQTLEQKVLRRDHTITSNSVNPILLRQYAGLYVTQPETLDALEYFHLGTHRLADDLGIKMENLAARGRKLPACQNLNGYYLLGEFGPGQNTSRTLVGDAPYRIELFKAMQGHSPGTPKGEPVFGMGFFLRHPDTMVLAQIQDIRGAEVPANTTDGMCAFVIAEKIAERLGLKQIVTYSHRTNPLMLAYPHKSDEMARVLKLNFDVPAKALGWEPLNGSADGSTTGYQRHME